MQGGLHSLLEQLRALEQGRLPKSLPLAELTGPLRGGDDYHQPKRRLDSVGRKAPSKLQPAVNSGFQAGLGPSAAPPGAFKSARPIPIMSSDSLRSLLHPPRDAKIISSSGGTDPLPSAAALSFSVLDDKQSFTVEEELKSQKRLQLSLQRNYSQLQDDGRLQEKMATKTIHVAAEFLPIELLIKHGQFAFVKERALMQMLELLLRGMRRTLRGAVAQWTRFVQSVNDVVSKHAAATIVRIARGCLGRLRVRRLLRSLDDATNRALKVAAVKSLGRENIALIIQCAVRRMLTRRITKPLLQQDRASRRLQNFLRSRIVHIHAMNQIARSRRRRRAAIVIQTFVRGMLGRRRFRRYWLAARRQSVQLKLSTAEGTFRYFFEQAGAATIIQRWWRKLPLVIRAVWRRKFLDYYTQRRAAWASSGPRTDTRKKRRKKKGGKKEAAVFMSKAQKQLLIANLVNPLVRGFLGRSLVRRILADKYITDMKRAACMTLVQSHVRRYLVGRRLPLVGPRSRAMVRKLRIWRPSSSSSSIQTNLHRRRGGVSYSSLRIPTAKTVDEMHQSVRRISRAFRRYKAHVAISVLRQKSHLLVASRLMRWARTCLMRHRVLRFRKMILPLLARCLQRVEAAKMIQGRWRTYAAMAWFHRLRRGRRAGVRRLQRFARRVIIARGRVKACLNKLRAELEATEAGAQLYAKTEVFTYIDFIWQGAKKIRTLDVPHEMQKFFASQGGGGQVDASRVGKIAKDAGLLSKDLDVKTLEMQFLKVKAPSEKRMSYPYWLELLTNIGAIKFLQIDPALLKGASNEEYEQGIAKARGGGQDDDVSSSFSASTSPEQIDMNRKIKAFRFGRYSGRTALIVKTTYEYLVPLPDWSKAATALGKKAAHIMAAKHLAACLFKAQRFVRNRLAIKRIDSQWRKTREQKLRRRLDRFATRIETLVRLFLGRRRIMRMAQTLYTKYIDDETQAVYWFNPRTGSAFWAKPRLLGHFDCGMPIRMPPPDDQYVALCGSCADKSAATYCDECDFAYCSACFAVAHRAGGKRKGHAQVPLVMCVQCDFQVATKECVQCQDLFCESCYAHVHAKGRLRLHISTWVTDPCQECGTRAAQWTQLNVPKSITGLLHWCVYCFRDAFHTEPIVVTDESFNNNSGGGGGFQLKRYNFQGKAVRDFRGQRDAMRAKRQVATDYAQRMDAMGVLKRVRAATNIQRALRGHLDRKHFASFIAERRAFFQLRTEQRPYRENPIYKLLEFWGVAPTLRSDTTLERVKKQYPVHMHDILHECLRNQWKEACRLQREQDEHLKQAGNPSTLQAYLARAAVVNSGRMLKAAQASLQRRTAILGVHKDKYRTARAMTKTSASTLKALVSEAERSAQEVELAVAIKEEREEELRRAEAKVMDFLGPRGLQKLVTQRRQQGVLLPFTVSLKKGSCLALTRWPRDGAAETGTKEASEEKAAEAPPPEQHQGQGQELEQEEEEEVVAYGRVKTPTASASVVPGRWAKALTDFDVMLVQGMHFQVLPNHLYDAPEEDEEKGALSKGGDDDDDDDDDDDGDNDDEGSSVGSADDEGKGDNDEDAERDLYPHIPLTAEHICLDRPWVFDSVEDVACYRDIPKVFYMRPLHALGNGLLASYVPQKGVAITAITLHKLAGLNLHLASMFDEESETGLWLKENARRLQEQRDGILRVSRSMVDMSYDFSLRRTLTKTLQRRLKGLYASLKSVGKMVQRVAADEAANGASWEVWEQSKAKTEVEVYVEFNTLPPSSEKLGAISLDLKAPVVVMREYVQRAFIVRLNELQGDAFLFQKQRDDGTDFTLPRDEEIKTFAATFCPFKMDSRTMEGANKVVLVLEPLEPGETGTYIQPFLHTKKKQRKVVPEA